MPSPALGSQDLAAAVVRVADRLRALSDVRLAQPPRGGAAYGPGSASGSGALSVADQAHALAQALADAAQGVEERAGAQPPARRALPRLGDLAVGDQVAVTGSDLVAACAGVGADEAVWTAQGRAPASAVVARALTDVRGLSRLI